MLKLTVAVKGEAKVIADMQSKIDVMVANLRLQLNYLALKLQKKIVSEKLSGQVLAHRSGKLAGSIHAQTTKMMGDRLSVSVTGAGGPAFYGRVHEYGGTRNYLIEPKTREALAWLPNVGPLVSPYSKAGIKVLRGMQAKGTVRAMRAISQFHAMGGVVVMVVHHPPLPRRPFMQPSLDEMRAEIVEQLRLTVRASLT
jgi:hypothetical protein